MRYFKIAIKKYPVFILLFITLILELIIFQKAIFDNFILNSNHMDLTNEIIPQIIHWNNFLYQGEIPFWSFSVGIGQNIYLNYATSIFDPFVLLWSLCPPQWIIRAMVYVYCLKILMTAFFFYFYLKRLAIPNEGSIIFSIAFAFSALLIFNIHIPNLSTLQTCFAFLLFALEHFFLYRQGRYLTLAIFFTAIIHPYYLILATVFIIIYSLCRLPVLLSLWPKGITGIVLIIKKAGVYYLIGILLSCFVFLPGLHLIFSSPRILSFLPESFSAENLNLVFVLLKTYAPSLIGEKASYQNFSSFAEIPTLYCGLFTLIMIPISFYRSSKQQKISYIFILIFILLYNTQNLVQLITSGGIRNIPQNRYYLIVNILLIYLGVNGFKNFKLYCKEKNFSTRFFAVDWIALLTTFSLLILLLIVHSCYPQAPYRQSVYIFTLCSLVIYMIYFILCRRFRLSLVFPLFFMLIEISFFTLYEVSPPDKDLMTIEHFKNNLTYTNTSYEEAFDFIRKRDTSFYRVHKMMIKRQNPKMFAPLNEALVLNFAGTSVYNTFVSPSMQEFYLAMKEDHILDKKAFFAKKREVLNILSSKYLIAEVPLDLINIKFVKKIGPIYIYENVEARPLVVPYRTGIDYSLFNMLTQEEKQKIILNVIISDKIKYANSIDIVTDFPVIKKISLLPPFVIRDEEKWILKNKDQNNISGIINLLEPAFLLFSIPYDSGWRIFVNSKEHVLEKVNSGLIGLELQKGQHNIDLRFRPRLIELGLVETFVGILFCFRLLLLRRKQSILTNVERNELA